MRREGERRLSVKSRPAWRNIVGPQDEASRSGQHRTLNPFADINCFGATIARSRILDTKGELGARPVQRWKEMLRT